MTPKRQTEIETRKRELLITYGRVRSAVQGLVTQNANAMALFEEIRRQFEKPEIEGHFVPVHFASHPLPDLADRWIKKMDRLLSLTTVSTPEELSTPPIGESASPTAPKESPRTTPATASALPRTGDLIRIKEVCLMFGGIVSSTLYRGIQTGKYPKPIKVGPNTSRWSRKECEELLNRLMVER
jgi:predicted DNA-binding transcriptional regulator AlpA